MTSSATFAARRRAKVQVYLGRLGVASLVPLARRLADRLRSCVGVLHQRALRRARDVSDRQRAPQGRHTGEGPVFD